MSGEGVLPERDQLEATVEERKEVRKEGREEEFEELRKLVQKRMFNSRDVEQFYTFTVNRDIVTDERAALKV